MAMQTGVVKFFDNKKGYGFITPDEGGPDLFVHFSDIQSTGFKTLQQGQRVNYMAATGPKGKQAKEVRPLDEGK